MCNKNSPIKRRKAPPPPKPARKSRTRTRKPKYLSLKLQLSSPLSKKTQKPTISMPLKQQLNLFPLHPENLVQEHNNNNIKEITNDDQVSDHVAFLFETAADSSTSLNGILDSTATTTTTTTTTTEEDGSAPPRLPLSPSLTYVYIGKESEDRCGDVSSSLVKTAMKCKERDASEERWVCYWELVEKKLVEQEEVSSCCYAAADALEKMVQTQAKGDDKIGLVGLKLDYQQILNAWSDKGPLYIKGDSPQIVPDVLHAHTASMDGWGNLWRVPEMESIKMKDKGEEKEGWKLGQREASVLRYKEKRQSRLFAKKIRYEVRKLNAEKRPRLKGRFVKRNGE
ncbi:hypothetical protein JCGZ_10206 [Jatropha curcas]|uniref:CCT domain-containing protein n=1 Tax=Jatropha curcas TaxID=180498 RepID=A0A067LD08_JATCU|nr:uncharacterized protein LOC105633500 [Jatropha curcas]KDP46366.1 hypothetical protein JCGZ_10206 [Jatropha curcas]